MSNNSLYRIAETPPAPKFKAEILEQSERPGRPILIAACVSGFLFQFDLTALSAALPDIASGLSMNIHDQAWVIDIYSLALIFALPLAGPIADQYGRRRVFVSGAVLFATASALCATATTLLGLLTWRAVQGVSGAALTASASAFLAASYGGPRRAWAFGMWGTVVGASMVAGPPLGALIAAVFGWPWIFWINVPVCIVLTGLICRTSSNEIANTKQTSLDWAGPMMLAMSVGFIALALLSDTHGGNWLPTPFTLGGAVIAGIVFVLIERRHKSPSIDLKLFGSPPFFAMCLVPIASSIGFWSLLVHLPQMARGPMTLSPVSAGILLTVLTVPMFILPSLGARLAAKLPADCYFGGGLAIIGVADLLLACAVRDLASQNAIYWVTIALLIAGCGTALFNAQITAAAVSAVPPDRAATASAVCVTMRQIGFGFGIALIGSVLHRGDLMNYSEAFAVVGGCTFTLATIVVVLLRKKGSLCRPPD